MNRTIKRPKSRYTVPIISKKFSNNEGLIKNYDKVIRDDLCIFYQVKISFINSLPKFGPSLQIFHNRLRKKEK